MTERPQQERSVGLGKMEGFQLETLAEMKTSVSVVAEISPSSLSSPVVEACLPATAVSDISVLAAIEITKTEITSVEVQTGNTFPPLIFNHIFTSPSRPDKKQKKYTRDGYSFEFQDRSMNRLWTESIRTTPSDFQHGSVFSAEPNLLEATDELEKEKVDQPSLRSDIVYKDISHAVIAECLGHMQVSAEGKICVNDMEQTVNRVANLIAAFVRCNSTEVMLTKRTSKSMPTGTNDAQVLPQDFQFVKLVESPSKAVNEWCLTSPEYYTGILPSDIIKRLETRKCVVDKKRGKVERCGHNLSPKRKESAISLLQEVARLPKPLSCKELMKLLDCIISAAICSRKHQDQPRSRLQNLNCRFSNPLDESQLLERAQFEKWIYQVTGSPNSNGLPMDRQIRSCENRSNTDDTETGFGISEDSGKQNDIANLITYDGKSSDLVAKRQETILSKTPSGDSVVRHFAPFQWNCEHRHLSPENLVATIARSRLTKQDTKNRGRLYTYGTTGGFGWVKIGHTKQTVRSRLSGWHVQCGYDVSEHEDITESENLVPHPLRAENLVHAELKDKRYQVVECRGCKKTHIEWFKEDPERARAIVKKWTDWMRESDPYDEEGYFRTDTQIELPVLHKPMAEVAQRCVREQRKDRSSSSWHQLRRSDRLKAQQQNRDEKNKS